MKLIDKDALLAETKKLKKRFTNQDDEFSDGYHYALKLLISLLDTLEIEVDFDALGILAEHLLACDAHAVSPKYRDGELDLLEELKNNKAQKGE